MDDKLFLLSGENPDLAREEAEALFGKAKPVLDRLLVVKTNETSFERLAYTRKVLKLLFKAKSKDIINKINSFNWNKIYKKNFCVRVLNLSGKPVPKEIEFADIIWKKLKSPKTELSKPETSIEFIFAKNEVYCGLVLFNNEESFSERRPHLRPEFSPISLNPKLARAMVNLTEIKSTSNSLDKKSKSLAATWRTARQGTLPTGRRAGQNPQILAVVPPSLLPPSSHLNSNEVLLDPFCGTAGILIEAGLMGFPVVGYDIDDVCLKKAKINLDYYKIKKYKLIKRDATEKWPDNAKYIVADLPYGRSAKLSDEMLKLYSEFLANLKKMKVKRAVVTFPSGIDYKKIIRKSKLKIKHEFNIYIHKSLTKKMAVLE